MNELLATLYYKDTLPDSIKLLLNISLIPAMMGLVSTIEVIDILGPEFGVQAITELLHEDRFHHRISNLNAAILIDDINNAYRLLEKKIF